MSTCPAKDIHCLYADDELQEPFKTEFEIHTAHCEHCRKILAAYRSLRAEMQDSSDITAFSSPHSPQAELDESYKRLKARLSYKKVILPGGSFASVSSKLIPAAAAAVLVFTALLPLLVQNTKTTQNPAYIQSSIHSIRAEPIQKRGIVAAENVSASSLASMLGTRYQFTLDTPQLTALDVFKPELSKNTNFIRIPLTDVSQMPIITLPQIQTAFDRTEDTLR